MNNLFNKNDADFCPLVDYVNTFIDEGNHYFNFFQLPPIQRNSVWNVAQIERLWDSILRGYPIGSFLVSPRHKGNATRDFYNGNQIKSTSEGFFLLDGQQRTRALLLGFKSNENARLWIDLQPNLIFENIELNDRKFLLRVLTNYQPWGMRNQNPAEKLYESQKYKAREELKLEHIHYDYEIVIDNGENKEQSEIFSWPVEATLPIPLDELINLCGGTTGVFKMPEWESVCKLIPVRYFSEPNVSIEPTEHYYEIITAIEQLINKTNDEIKTRTVVLLFQNENKSDQVENVQDDMEVLFRRINAGGTVLQGEEMAYSLLKSSWDDAYKMVSNIVNDKNIGYLLPSTGIVMAATRMARFIQDKNDASTLTISNFRKWIGEKEDQNSFLEIIQSLLQTDISGKSKLHSTIQSFCNLVIYRQKNPEDIGLPKKLLLSIKPALLYPVFTWIYNKKSNAEILENNRVHILRYLVFCKLTVGKHDKASKKIMEILKDKIDGHFPDKEIYETLLKEELTVPVPKPAEFSKPFNVKADGFLRHYNDVFNITDDPHNSFRYWFWNDSKEMLLWFQRSYASIWFDGYDPTSSDAYDTPYDWDHIMPKSHLITSGATPNTHSIDKDLNNKFYWNRNRYVNSIGNYRLWPFWANRKDNNKCHTTKLRINENDLDADIDAFNLKLISANEFLNASAIPKIDEKLWLDAGGSVRNWPLDRRLAWQTAVEKRTIYLYETLYTTFEYDKWQD